jgi:hypothetical protein
MLVDLFCGNAAGAFARQPPLSLVRGAHGIPLLNSSEKLTAINF